MKPVTCGQVIQLKIPCPPRNYYSIACYPNMLQTRLPNMQYVELIDECEMNLLASRLFSMHLTLCPVLQDQSKKQSSLCPCNEIKEAR